MITNEREYRITKSHVTRFEETLNHMRVSPAPSDLHPKLWKAEQDAIESQIEEMQQALLEYEALKSGQVTTTTVQSLDDLPKALIQSRIAQGYTQKDLASKLGVKEQQVQQDEENLYGSASLRRLKRVAEVLGVSFEGNINLLAKS